jgi:hypothetical protein
LLAGNKIANLTAQHSISAEEVRSDEPSAMSAIAESSSPLRPSMNPSTDVWSAAFIFCASGYAPRAASSAERLRESASIAACSGDMPEVMVGQVLLAQLNIQRTRNLSVRLPK